MLRHIITALEHVRASHPEVVKVYFDGHQHWLYTDREGNAPEFGSEVDDRLLNAALDEAWNEASIPAVFLYDPTNKTVKEIQMITNVYYQHQGSGRYMWWAEHDGRTANGLAGYSLDSIEEQVRTALPESRIIALTEGRPSCKEGEQSK